jgi:NAD-dependent dihydropyrimidine dehydrogenase PreA subunit
MDRRIAVIIARGQSRNPAKRALEEGIAVGLLERGDVDVTVVASLYDLKPNSPAISALRRIEGDMIVLSWFYPRAAHWTLDQNGITGQVGETMIAGQEGRANKTDHPDDETEGRQRVIDDREVPDRRIYCLDLRLHTSSQPYLDEIGRVVAETNDPSAGGPASSAEGGKVNLIDEDTARRWYPVIDYSRCTNCMECVDFCLFGVYGLDDVDNLLVEQPDNCRKGCPACSRVCPANAIMFPLHKTPAIAGGLAEPDSLKIDLSQLFGAPETAKTALEVARRERDEQIVRPASNAIETSEGVLDQEGTQTEPKDELDELLDELDELDP